MKDQPIACFQDYFDAFEATVIDDDWQRLAPFFAAAVSYHTADGTKLLGREEVIGYLTSSVDALDRRFDSRRFLSPPQLEATEDSVTMLFTVCYQKAGLPELRLRGREIAWFKDGQIVRMEDEFELDCVVELEQWLAEHGAALAA